MPIESAPNKIPEEALNAFLDGILAELSSPPDPAMLTKVRSIFRKRIPLHMRSYAAALLILRAAGITRNQPQKPVAAPAKALKDPSQIKPSRPVASAAATTDSSDRKPTQQKSSEGMVPLFVSMGKRQRLRPQELRTLISEKAEIPSENLGRVHLFDNYSFIDVPEIHAEKIIQASDGAAFKGRTIEIKPAKKRAEQPQEKEPNE